jgi:hypothetical protein
MAVSSQVVTSQLPAAFETYYKEGAEGSKGLIPQAFQLYGQGTPQAFQAQYVDPLKAAGLYTALIVLLDSHQRNNSLELSRSGNLELLLSFKWVLVLWVQATGLSVVASQACWIPVFYNNTCHLMLKA